MKQSDPREQSGRKPGLCPKRLASWLLLVGGIGMLGLSIKLMLPPAPPKTMEPAQPLAVSSLPANVGGFDQEYLKDKLFITQERADYQSGQMVLKIPRMGVDAQIQKGVTNPDMDLGPGLFEYSQLPGTPGCNVSIGAHRDIKGAEFYFIHKLSEGDLFYLIYNQTIYVYQYKDTKVIEPSDWGPIYLQGFDCLTLISCTPIGTSRQRIVLRAELKEALPYTEDYRYRPWVEGIDKPYAWERSAPSWDALPQSSPASAKDAPQSATGSKQ